MLKLWVEAHTAQIFLSHRAGQVFLHLPLMGAKRKTSGGEGGNKSQKSVPALPSIPPDSRNLPHIKLFDEWLYFRKISYKCAWCLVIVIHISRCMPETKLHHPLCEFTETLRGQKCLVQVAPWTSILPSSWTQRTGKSKSLSLSHLARNVSFLIAGESCGILHVLGERICTRNWSAASSV